MSLTNAQRALEIVDARLVATQSRLAEFSGWDGDPETGKEIIDKIVDHLDLIIGDVRAASEEIAKHECPDLKEHLENFWIHTTGNDGAAITEARGLVRDYLRSL